MTDHLITKDQAHGAYRSDVEPALRVRPGSGHTVTFETDDEAYAQMEQRRDLSLVTATMNPVTGPVWVEGAEPGDTLLVHVHDIALADQGWSLYIPGAGALANRMGDEFFVRRVSVEGGVARLTDTVSCPVAPMIGCVGVAPATGEASSVMPSRPTGGNLDLTDAAPGSTVHLPVAVEGAMLAIGDLHAVMSRGESSFVAIEVAGRATVSVDLVKRADRGRILRAPHVDTGREWVCVGLGDPLQDAVQMAYEELFDVLTLDHGYSRTDAYVVMSALAHTELGGPTGSRDPDPMHPLRAVGAVTLARIARDLLPPRP
ncbi:MAG: acetamidase/formamidase family protein [Actinomycetota bacterium]|nr:acetamidase/formamidase family protein [Actinomycetota bacterium]